MLGDYPTAMMDPYFISSSSPSTGSGNEDSVDFVADTTSGDAPLTVKFTDLSGGQPIYWLYRFGDGSTSTASNPSHTYRLPGTYTVNLTIWRAEGTVMEPASMEKPAYITVSGVPAPEFAANFTAGPVSGQAPLTVRFTDTSTGDPISYLYRFGDGSIFTGPNPTHTYYLPGSYTVSLTVRGSSEQKPVNNTVVKENLIVVI
jgi:PKD repeat protein